MNHSKQARILLAVAFAFIAALAVIGWWMSHPGNMERAARAVAMLGCVVVSIHQLRRFPRKASPMLLCGAVAGIAVPFITASLGPAFVAVFAISIAVVWAGIAIARARTPVRP